MKQKKLIAVITISVFVVIICSIPIGKGFIDVLNGKNITQDNVPTEHLHPKTVYGFYYYTNISNVTTIFYTDDIFAVGNPIQSNVLIYLKGIPHDLNVTIIQASAEQDVSWMNGTDSDTYLKGYKDNEKYVSVELSRYIISWNATIDYTPQSEDTQNLWLLWKPIDSHGKWAHEKFPLPTISPAYAFQQVKTNKAILSQIAETKRTNAITTGLTYVIVGFIPVGLVAEFWIEYLIENHFYRREKVKTVNKTEPWNCDFFPDKESSQNNL